MKLDEPTVLKIREHTVQIDKDISPSKVMITGDWHISPIISERQADFLRDAVDFIRPDAIILQGDIVDSPKELKRETSLKKLLSELKICSQAAPTMMVLGSHDYITPTEPPVIMKDTSIAIWKKICARCNVKLLINESFSPIPGISFYGMFQDERCIIGIDKNGRPKHCNNATGFLKNLAEAELEVDRDKLNWFIAHAPLLSASALKKLEQFDVMSFGHTHGGIVPRGMDEILEKLGLTFGLISTDVKPLPRHVRGARFVGDSTLVVINPGMTGAQFCAPRFLQNMNFVKAAEVSVVKLVNAPKDRKSD